ncbi:MAG: endonuclease/exonuclease/phosphatase family protein [Bacillota bacterium]|nr:endonuclease/exonuclease/phosphatase family protein [Bacillota bacterium]
MKIVTFNVRCVWKGTDGINSFVNRSGLILDKIGQEKPDIIAFQEVTDKIYDFFKKNLVGYEIAGHGRDKNYDGEGVFIAYRRDSVNLYSLNVYWLSDTPEVPGSRFEVQSECPRTCAEAMLKCRESALPIRVYNVHLDHTKGTAGDNIRTKELNQIIQNINKNNFIQFMPSFVLGDFNAKPSERCIETFERKLYLKMKDVSAKLGDTFHNFKGETSTTAKKIDYIYTDIKTATKLVSVEKWTDFSDGIYLSDHYPICAEFQL